MGKADTTILLITASLSLHNLDKPAPEWFKPIWILMKQEVMGQLWHQLDHMQINIASPSRRITTSAPHHSFFTGRVLFLMPKNSVKALKANIWDQKSNKIIDEQRART